MPLKRFFGMIGLDGVFAPQNPIYHVLDENNKVLTSGYDYSSIRMACFEARDNLEGEFIVAGEKEKNLRHQLRDYLVEKYGTAPNDPTENFTYKDMVSLLLDDPVVLELQNGITALKIDIFEDKKA